MLSGTIPTNSIVLFPWLFRIRLVMEELKVIKINPALLQETGYFISQSIFPSSIVIRDGTYSTAFHMIRLTITIIF